MESVLDWLAEGDPSIVWQVERDLTGADEAIWSSTRARVAREGWGKALLDLQDPDGKWSGGLYTPKWTSTNYTLLELRRLGLDPANEQARRGVQVLFDSALWIDGGLSYWKTHDIPEKCVNAMALSLAAYFRVDDSRVDGLAAYLIGGRLEDGAWNCEDYRQPVSHSSFHTTISVLEALLLWGRWRGTSDADVALATGHEFMLEHRMFKSHTTGEVINDAWTKPWFPPRWHYDVFRGLDHMRDADVVDARLDEAVGVVRERRLSNGAWPIGPSYSGERHFKFEEGRGGGRWNTLRALRVLGWWESQAI